MRSGCSISHAAIHTILRRLSVPALLLILALFLHPLDTFAQSHPLDFPAKVRVLQNANLREGPSTETSVIGSASVEQVLELVGCNTDCTWYQLSSGEWIAAFLVELASSPVAPSGQPTTEVANNLPVLNKNANLRAGPGMEYEIVGELPQGTTILVSARDPSGEWVYTADGAWIAAFLIDNLPDSLITYVPYTPTPNLGAAATNLSPTATSQPTTVQLSQATPQSNSLAWYMGLYLNGIRNFVVVFSSMLGSLFPFVIPLGIILREHRIANGKTDLFLPKNAKGCVVCGTPQHRGRMQVCQDCGEHFCSYPIWKPPREKWGDRAGTIATGLGCILTAVSILGGIIVLAIMSIPYMIFRSLLPDRPLPPVYWKSCGSNHRCLNCGGVALSVVAPPSSSSASDSSSDSRDYDDRDDRNDDRNDDDRDDGNKGSIWDGWLIKH